MPAAKGCKPARKLYEYKVFNRADGVLGTYAIGRALKGQPWWQYLRRDGSWSAFCSHIRSVSDFKKFTGWWDDIYTRKFCIDFIARLGREGKL